MCVIGMGLPPMVNVSGCAFAEVCAQTNVLSSPPVVSQSLLPALLATFALPWLVGEWVKTGLQPGLADDAARAAMQVDFIVIGTMVFTAAMWLVLACGCWMRVMQGPPRRGDPFPTDDGRAP